MFSLHRERPMCLVKMLTRDFGIEPSSDNDLKKQSTAPTSGNYFWTSWKLLTTHSNNSWNCGILKQIILISIVFNDVKCIYKYRMQFLLFDKLFKALTKKGQFLYEERQCFTQNILRSTLPHTNKITKYYIKFWYNYHKNNYWLCHISLFYE